MSSGTTPTDPAVIAWNEKLDSVFAGDAACKSCHADQFAAHQRSGHSHTIRAAFADEMKETIQKERFRDPQRDYAFEFGRRGDKATVEVPSQLPSRPLEIDWLLGSGQRAQTALSLSFERKVGVEHRWTAYANGKIGLTPAHDRFDYDPSKPSLEAFGRVLNWDEAMQCLGCHTTALPPDLEPTSQTVRQNISCERCHGPRKEHVRLARMGRGDESKPVFHYGDADAYLNMCAQCHRGESHLTQSVREEDIVRFQPLGLRQSKCYVESKGAMTCSTCHDPHDAVSTDRTAYRQVCLECHQAPRNECSGDDRSDCVSCHMPASKWDAGLIFHDHRIQRPGDSEQTR